MSAGSDRPAAVSFITAPLTGITAVAVGVILNLATFFAYHALWPQGFESSFEWFSADWDSGFTGLI